MQSIKSYCANGLGKLKWSHQGGHKMFQTPFQSDAGPKFLGRAGATGGNSWPPNQPPAMLRATAFEAMKIIGWMAIWLAARRRPTITALVPRPTNRPCLRLLAVVAPARALPASVARAVISIVTNWACMC